MKNMKIGQEEKQLIRKFLKKVPVFRNFSGEHLDQVTDDFRILEVSKLQNIVFQSEDSTDLYIVVRGRVKASFMNTDGNEFVLSTFNEGDFFGEMSLIDGRPRSATVVAEEETALAVLKREKLLRAIKQNPMIAVDLMTALVERLRKADGMIESLAFLDVRERLIKYLTGTAEEEGGPAENGYYRIKKRTHKDLASSIGSSREAVSKMLKILAVERLVTEDKGCFLVSADLRKEPD